MINTQVYKGRAMKRTKQLYCGCGEPILRGIYCPTCKVKKRSNQQNKYREARRDK